MPILHVRDIPDDLYASLKQLAVSDKRSLSSEVAILLRDAVNRNATRQRSHDALERLTRRRESATPLGPERDSVVLLREDRED